VTLRHAPGGIDLRQRLDARLRALREGLRESGIEALAVTNATNVAYLCGLRASAAALVVTRNDATLITDFRYREAARRRIDAGDAPPGVRLEIVEQTYDQAIVDAVRRLGVRILGVEAAHLTIKRFQWIRQALHGTASVEPTDRQVERLRIVKDETEILIMREAAGRLSAVAGEVWSLVARGRTEREIAADLDAALVRGGFERPAFETIVASGPNSALPHARPTTRRIERGDPVLLDFGGVYDGYSVDLTRVGVLGPATAPFLRLHEAVAASQAAAIAAVGPGVSAAEVDRAAREALAASGFGREAFGHGTGHGLGLEVHEEPRIAPRGSGERTDAPLEAGMIFTVEPGAYVPGVGGVRIEDDVLVAPGGVEVLTSAPRELHEIDPD
jgi:Xaa-Pro aminopeptidase